MHTNIVPTKGNLLSTKKTLQLSRLGFELLDKKRNILIREMMQLIESANEVKDKIEATYSNAYLALQRANITLGVCEDIAKSVTIEDSLEVSFRSVMGVEIPMVSIEEKDVEICYGLWTTNSQFDHAFILFHEVKMLTARLAEIENSIYKIAIAIKKTQSRANALNNVIIPRFSENVKYITDALEEKEREEFSRMKVLKNKAK